MVNFRSAASLIILQFSIVNPSMDNFFATEVSANQSRPNTTGKTKHLDSNEESFDGYAKMKLIKSQLKKADQDYREALSSSKKTRASLDRANRTTQIVRVNFLKVYQSKKLRMLERNLLDERKERERTYHQECAEKARKIKLETQLQALLLKSQQQQHLELMRAKNRKAKECLRQEARLNHSHMYETARRQYLSVKNAHTELLIRKKKVSSMLQARAKHNYMAKMNREIQMLQSYNAIAKQMGDLDIIDGETSAQTTKSFFITRT